MAVDATTTNTSTMLTSTTSAPLLTMAELRTWTRREIADDDAFALAVIDAASLKVRQAASQPDWTIDTVVPAARLIAIQLAKRTYLNPDAVIAEGGIGPIGGDRYIEDFARTLELTDLEREDLEGMSPAAATAGNGLWVQPMTRGDLESTETVYYFDDSGSDWAIPMYEETVTP